MQMMTPQAPTTPGAREKLDPEVLRALVERGLLDEQTAMSLLETRHGWEEAATPGPEGTRTPGPFGMYVAAHPFEHMAAGLRRYKGLESAKKGQDQIEALRRRKKLYDTQIIDWASE